MPVTLLPILRDPPYDLFIGDERAQRKLLRQGLTELAQAGALLTPKSVFASPNEKLLQVFRYRTNRVTSVFDLDDLSHATPNSFENVITTHKRVNIPELGPRNVETTLTNNMDHPLYMSFGFSEPGEPKELNYHVSFDYLFYDGYRNRITDKRTNWEDRYRGEEIFAGMVVWKAKPLESPHDEERFLEIPDGLKGVFSSLASDLLHESSQPSPQGTNG